METKTMGSRTTSLDVISWLLWLLAFMVLVTTFDVSRDMSFRDVVAYMAYLFAIRVVLGLLAWTIWKIARFRRG